MKETKLFKNVTDRQLPDLEAVKKACTEQKPQKAKIFTLKPSRLIAVAVISAIIITGMVATFASQGGMLFFLNNKEQPTASESSEKASKSSNKSKTTSATVSNRTSEVVITPNTSATEKKKSKKADSNKKFYNLFDSYLRENGIEASKMILIGKIDDYAIFFADTQIAGNYTCDYIMGQHTFSTSAQRMYYGLGIYAVSEGLSCTLTEAYDMKLFADFGSVAELISGSGKLADFNISVAENDTEHQLLSEEFGTGRTTEAVPLGSTETYTLYYRVNGTYTGEYGYKLLIEDMVFDMTDSQKRYEPGLYVVNTSGVYNMTQAINDGIVADSDELATMIENASPDIPFNWTFSRAPEPESESENETTTEE